MNHQETITVKPAERTPRPYRTPAAIALANARSSGSANVRRGAPQRVVHALHSLDARKNMKTLSRIIMSLALTAPVALVSVASADDKPPTQASPDQARQDVTIDQLPKAVKATVQRETKGKSVQSITRSSDSSGGAAYEVKVVDGTKQTTIAIAADGKVTNRKVDTGASSAQPNSNSPGSERSSSDPSNPPSTGTPAQPNANPPSMDSQPPDKKPDDTRTAPPGR
jgi:hypothetical protein